MMKELKSIIERVITMKRHEVQELNFEDMKEDKKAEHKEASDKALELYKSLEETLTPDQVKILGKYSDAENFRGALENEHMFNRGVMMGLNELGFIREELGPSIVLL